jgi:hypothetical protein
MKSIVMVAAIAMFVAATPCAAGEEANYAPKGGYVRDARTAVAIAEAILNSVYGEQQIAGEKPLQAKRSGDVWRVSGALPPGYKGGVAEIWISKRSGRILHLSHGK